MKRASILAGAFAALSIPVFASAQAQPDAAAAERLKLVTSVQAQLGVPVDGQMGPQTHAAIKEFQRSKGLDASGQLDKETVVALGLDGPKPSAAAGASAHMQGKPSTPIGPSQPSEERAAEPLIKPAAPTGEAK
jgi:peptidoglycan hydrolase-like protein with peptidoglycan-binding domain